MKKVRNLSTHKYIHVIGDKIYAIEPGKEKSVDDEIADIWLKTTDVVLVDDGEKDKKIAELEQELAKAKATQDPNESLRADLIKQAKELKIKGVYGKGVSIETLEKKIAEAQAEQVTPTEENVDAQ